VLIFVKQSFDLQINGLKHQKVYCSKNTKEMKKQNKTF